MDIDRKAITDFVGWFWQDLSWYSHYISMTERQLVGAGEQERRHFAAMLRKTIGIDTEGFYDPDYNERFNSQYPKHLRYAFTVLCGSFVEFWLPALCEEMCTRKTFDVPYDKTKKKKRYERSKEFLRKSAQIKIPNPELDSLETILQIRNCIIHAYGDVLRSKDEQNLRACAGKIPGYNLAGDLIRLEKEFPPFVIKSIRELFQELFKLVGFYVLPEDFIHDVLTEPSNAMFSDQ
jgi:hypothetical protein